MAQGGLDKVPTVQCQPLSLIMQQLGMQHINFFVLDVEGALAAASTASGSCQCVRVVRMCVHDDLGGAS